MIGDRSASLTADSTGVTLQVGADGGDFDWPEISTIDCTPARRGRFTATVRLYAGTSYPCELGARHSDLRGQWIKQLHDFVSRYLGR